MNTVTNADCTTMASQAITPAEQIWDITEVLPPLYTHLNSSRNGKVVLATVCTAKRIVRIMEIPPFIDPMIGSISEFEVKIDNPGLNSTCDFFKFATRWGLTTDGLRVLLLQLFEDT